MESLCASYYGALRGSHGVTRLRKGGSVKEKDVEKTEVEEGYGLSEEEATEEAPNEYEVAGEAVEGKEDTEKKEETPPEVPPEEVTNAVYFPTYIRDGQTERHGDVPPVKFKFKPMTDEQRVEFYEAIAKAKNLVATRKIGHKMLARHIVESSLMVPDTENEGKFIKMDVSNRSLWKYVDPSVMQEMIDKVIGDIHIPESIRKNL